MLGSAPIPDVQLFSDIISASPPPPSECPAPDSDDYVDIGMPPAASNDDEDIFGFGFGCDDNTDQPPSPRVFASERKREYGIRSIGTFNRNRSERTCMTVNPFDHSEASPPLRSNTRSDPPVVTTSPQER